MGENCCVSYGSSISALSEDAPQLFQTFLEERLFKDLPFKSVHLINSSNSSEKKSERYSSLLQEKQIDIVCLGIGEERTYCI